jgi:hypothetical protein
MEQEPRDPSAEGAQTGDAAPADGAEQTGAGGPAYDALRRLEARLDRASDAAERLIAEVAARASSAADAARAPAQAQTPPAGWQASGDDHQADHAGELELLAQVLRSLRDLIPPELQRKLAEALRELLLAVRALIDWYLERVERRHETQAEVQDIPIL